MTHSSVTDQFGGTIKSLRQRQGWSQEVLAGNAGLNRSYLCELERGRAIPSLLTIEKLAIAFKINVTTMLQYAESQDSPKAVPPRVNVIELASVVA